MREIAEVDVKLMYEKFAIWNNICYNNKSLLYKRRVNYILKRRIIYHIKKSFKCLNLFFLLLVSIISIIAIKYKPAYVVTISGQNFGYVGSKAELEAKINSEILEHSGNVAFVTMKQFPEYKLEFIRRSEQTNEDEIINSLKQNAEITYKYYAVTFNNENKAYVNTLEEAEQVVADIKEEYKGDLELNIGISEYYTVNVDDAKKIEESADITLAKEFVENSVEQYADIQSKTINGIYLATTPVKGTITSRFGSIERVRYGAHTGLDIAAPGGTEILAVADGEVTYSAPMGTYGNLVIVTHGNGIQTYYAHCSKLLVKKGDKVTSGQNIALVGSTGNSTGNHLHLEIRINGQPVNPQKYLYRSN